MPATRRRHTWEYTPQYTTWARMYADQISTVLDDFCERWPQWYYDPQVSGWSLGFVSFSITVESRDQWFVGRRALRLLSAIRVHTDIAVTDIQHVSVEKLPAHDHRGKTYLKEHHGSASSDPG